MLNFVISAKFNVLLERFTPPAQTPMGQPNREVITQTLARREFLWTYCDRRRIVVLLLRTWGLIN